MCLRLIHVSWFQHKLWQTLDSRKGYLAYDQLVRTPGICSSLLSALSNKNTHWTFINMEEEQHYLKSSHYLRIWIPTVHSPEGRCLTRTQQNTFPSATVYASISRKYLFHQDYRKNMYSNPVAQPVGETFPWGKPLSLMILIWGFLEEGEFINNCKLEGSPQISSSNHQKDTWR